MFLIIKMCIVKNKIKIKQSLAKKQFANLKTLEHCNDEDTLAKTTGKLIFYYLDDKLATFRNVCRILFSTTQPAHIVTVLATAFLAYIFLPHGDHQPSPVLSFIYLGSFSTYVGSQMWMTFVSGLALYFSLPRHHFGNVQRVLFPKYFTLNSILSLITLTIYMQQHIGVIIKSQAIILTGSFLINLLIRLYLAPPLLRLMSIKNKIELDVGIGLEVGTRDVGILKNCPHYTAIYKAFRTVHTTIAIGNIIAMACTVLHLYHLSGKLHVL